MKKFHLIATLMTLGCFRTVFSQVTFNYTGGMQSYTVPLGTSAVCFTVCGARGMANQIGNSLGGLGGRVMGTLPVTAGQVLQIFVGGGGITSNMGGFNGGANGGLSNCVNARGGGGGGASDIRFAPYALADRQVVGGGGGGTGGNRVQGCGPGCGGGGGGGYYGGGGGGAYGGSPGFGGSQVGGGAGGASCCGCPVAPQPGAVGTFGNGGAGGGVGTNNQAANNPGCAGGVGGALVGGQGPNCTGGTGCPSTWAGASGGGGSNYTAPAVTGVTNTAGFQTGNGIVIINPNCCAQPTITAVSNPTSICVGQTATLTGGGAGVGGTYTWQPGNLNTPVITVSPSVTTVYTLSGTNTGSCTGTQTVMLTVNPLPTVTPGSNSPICSGNTLSLTVGAGATYTWTGPNAYTSNLQNPIIANSTTLNAGVYSVTVATAFGCVASGTTNVVITPPTVLTPSNTGPYCAGATINLSVVGAVSYTWTGPNLFTSNLQNPSIGNAQVVNGGVYTVVVTVGGGCTNSGTTNVVVNPVPTPTAGSNGPVCENQSINFTGAGGTTYTWTGPGFNSNAPNPVISVAQMTNGGIYTLTVSDNNNCVNSTTLNLVVNPLPIIATGNHTVCENSPINLFANGANTYAWTGPNFYSANVQNPTIPVAAVNMTGQYVIIGTSAQNCTSAAVSNVTVIALPTPNFTSNSPICVGAQLTLNGTGGTTYTWTGPNGFSSNLQNPNIPVTTMAANGNYSLMVTVGICTAMTSGAVIVNPLPTPTITSNGPVCLTQQLNLSGPGGYTFSWQGPNGYSAFGNNPSIPFATNLNAGTYTATATDGNNCTNTVTMVVVINPFPIISAVGSTVCSGKTVSLSASGGTVYTWSGPSGFTSSDQTPLILNGDISMIGQYSVTVTNSNGCTSTSITNVHVNVLPTVTVSVNTPVCSNQTINLNAGSLTGLSYVWSGPKGFTSTQQNPQLTNVETSFSGFYTVTVTDNIGCTAKEPIAVLVNPLPVVSIFSDKANGCVPVCITFSPQSTNPLQNCSWQFGDGTTATGLIVSKCYQNAGGYLITSKFNDIHGCSNTATYSVNADPIPVADFNFAPSKPVVNENIDFTDASYGANVTGWTWNFSHLKNQIVIKPVASLAYENAGTYVIALMVTSDKGCKDTIVKSITVGEDFGIYVPDAFSPNGDGINDIFQPKGFGIVKYELNVYDRWGEKMYSTKDFNQGWDGTFPRRSENIIKEDIYVWNIKVVNVFGKQKEYTGHVTLLK